MSKVKMAKIQ